MSNAVETELNVRRAGPEDVDAILELVRASMGTGDIPRERTFWDWKHVRNPFGESAVLVAEGAGKLVGLRVFMRWDWRIGDRTVRAVRAVDTSTHPEWQGRGIFSRLTRALAEQMKADGVDLIFNTPNSKSRPGYLKMGWVAVGRVDLMIRLLRPLRIARILATSRSEAVQVPEEAEFGLPVDEFLRIPGAEALVTGANRTAPAGRLSTPRSIEYLHWRYAENPAFRYRVLVEPENAPEIAAVLRVRKRGQLTEMRFCEVLTNATAGKAMSLGRRVIRRLDRRLGADYISGMATPRTPAWYALAGAGFVPVPRLGPILTVRTLRDGYGEFDPTRRQAWSFSIGDLELF